MKENNMNQIDKYQAGLDKLILDNNNKFVKGLDEYSMNNGCEYEEYDRYYDLVQPENGKPKTNRQVDNLAKYAMLKAGIDPYKVMALPESESEATSTKIKQCFGEDIPAGIKDMMLINDTLEHDRKTRLKHLPPHIDVDYFPYTTLKVKAGSVYSSIVYRPIYVLI